MGFLGIDQSLNATGLCRLDVDAKVTAVATVIPDGLLDGKRLAFIKRAVVSMATDIEFAALEGYAYDAVGRVFELGEIGGVIKVLLVEANIPYVIVPPVLVKKYATGSATANKAAMLHAAKDRGSTFQDDNQADAFFLAHIARAYSRKTAKYRCEMEVIHTLQHPPVKKTRRRPRRLVNAAI